jgi:hypothetical protein
VVTVEGACASAPHTRSFQDLPRYLEEGSKIDVTETTGATTTGRLTMLSPTSLAVLTAGDVRDVPESRVVRIRRQERWPHSRWHGARAALGAVLGTVVRVHRTVYMARIRQDARPQATRNRRPLN